MFAGMLFQDGLWSINGSSNGLVRYFSAVVSWRHFFKGAEYPVEMGHAVEPAAKTDVRDVLIGI